MNTAPPILLVGPYASDRMTSIMRFTRCLARELSAHTSAELIAPKVILGRFIPSGRGAGKWLGYFDKFVIFSAHLQRRAREKPGAIVHLCDQSSAVYTQLLRNTAHLVTCNDLIAVRTALGEFPGQQTRWTGRQLQRRILRGLKNAHRITCISEATCRDLIRLTRIPPDRVDVTSMGLNDSFAPLSRPEAEPIVSRFFSSGPVAPFILHVGGTQWYKNRTGILRIYNELLKILPNPPMLLLAGAELTDQMRKFISQHDIETRVLTATHCAHAELRALYSTAECLLFPSLAEGFGWPIIEAQACGCRVVTSDRAPMTEIAGTSATFIDPENPRTGAASLVALLAEPAESRRARVASGLNNAQRFSTATMVEQYLRIYTELAPALAMLQERRIDPAEALAHS